MICNGSYVMKMNHSTGYASVIYIYIYAINIKFIITEKSSTFIHIYSLKNYFQHSLITNPEYPNERYHKRYSCLSVSG